MITFLVRSHGVFLFVVLISAKLLADLPPTPSDSSTASPSIHFSEISRKVVQFADHKVTFVRVRPPVLPSPIPPAPPPAPTAEQAAETERVAAKEYVSLSLSATVYLRAGHAPLTHLVWFDPETNRRREVWSNTDFRYLASVTQFETATHVFGLFLVCGAETCVVDDLPASARPLLPDFPFESGVAEYFIQQEDANSTNAAAIDSASPNEASVLEGLDHLHGIYQVRLLELKAVYEQNEARNMALEAERLRNPPRPRDAELIFWQIQK